jgi:hypothetical protein
VAWFGGTYFDSRGNFPLRVGEPVARMKEVFGESEGSLAGVKPGSGRPRAPEAVSYSGFWILLDGERIAGAVVGDIGDGLGGGELPFIGELYRAGAGAGRVSRADCAEILDKADRLMEHDSTTHPRDPAKREREIAECMSAPPALIQCAKAATTWDQLRACEKR